MNFMKSKKFVTYIKNNLVLMKMIKRLYLDYIIKSEIIAIILKNIEEMLICNL